MKSLHILMVSEYFPPHAMGGGELSALALAQALVRHGVQVSVLTSHLLGDHHEDTLDGVKVYRRLKTGADSGTLAGNLGRLGFDASVARELPALIKTLKPDVVHAMNVTSLPGVGRVLGKKGFAAVGHLNSPLAFCPKGTKIRHGKECTIDCSFVRYFIPCFATSQELGRLTNAWYLKYNPIVWAMLYARWARVRASLANYQHFLPISSYMQTWLGRSNVPKKNSTVVPNIIDLSRFASIPSTENAVPKILYLGGYVHMKGLHIVLDALKGVHQKYELHCYGTGNEKRALQDKAWKNSVSAVFHDDVSQKELPHIVASSDLLAFPSLVPEAFGRVALEAMSAGKPVIASRIGGITDIVVDKETGFLVTAGDVERWRAALLTLLKNDKKRRAMGSAGRKRAHAEFTEEGIVRKVIAAYRKVAQ
jgi:glycosyltransferase involved in cell wall biosynthesis